MFDPTLFEPTTNTGLVGPSRLTLAEFYETPVSHQQYAAREAIYHLEDVIATVPGHLTDKSLTPIHKMIDGVYTRELTMPAGTIIVGKRHAQEHLVVMTKGFCTVLTERGWEDLSGSCSFHSPAGEKRVLFVHEETTWITIHRTQATDLEVIESELILADVPTNRLNIRIKFKGE